MGDTVSVLAIAALAALLLACWVWLCVVRPATAVIAIVAYAVWSSHALALLYAGGVDAHVVRALISVKDAGAVALATVLLARGLLATRDAGWLRSPILLVALASLPPLVIGLSNVPTVDALLSFRNALVPFLAASIALLLRDSERRAAAVGSVVVITVAAVYSLVEYILPLTYLTDVIQLGNYWEHVKEQPFFVSRMSTHLPGNFFTSSGSRRLSGSFGDPLAAGYALAGALLLSTHVAKARPRMLVALILSFALLLTFTRAGLLFAMLVFLPIGASRYGHMSRGRWLAVGVAASAILALLVVATPLGAYVRAVISGNDGSTNAHLGALRGLGQHRYTPFGGGFGSAGAAVGAGTENVFVTLALQIGIVGLILFLVAFSLLARRGQARWRSSPLPAAYLGGLSALLIICFISEQLLTFNAGFVVVLSLFLGPGCHLRAAAGRRSIGSGLSS